MKRTTLTRRRALGAIGAISALALSGLAACGGGDETDSPQHRAAITQAASNRLKALHAQYPGTPGIVAHLLVEPARFSWAGSVGVAERASGRPLTPNATFRTASVTKTFTAAAIFRLAEKGMLSTADAIERHLPRDLLQTLRAGGYDTARITVDHLLTHRAGLPDFALSLPYVQAVLANPTHRWTRGEQLQVAMALGAPLFEPGSDYTYSDTGFILLGEMIERLTGQQLGAAYRSLLGLDALGLVATYQERIDPVPAAAGERSRQDLLEGVDDSMIDPSTDLWGAGGLVSDARDLALFMRALVEGKVLGPASRQQMMSPASVLPGAPGNASYARGLLRFEVAGAPCWGHDGFSGAFAVHCPTLGTTVAGSLNATNFVGAPEPIEVASDLIAAIAAVR